MSKICLIFATSPDNKTFARIIPTGSSCLFTLTLKIQVMELHNMVNRLQYSCTLKQEA